MALPPPPPGFQLDMPQPGLGRPVVRRNPQPTPQTQAQAQGDVLSNREALARIAKLEREAEQKGTPGQEAVDTEFAKDYVAYKAGGGFADVRKQLNQLRETSNLLKSGANMTGPILGRMPDAITSWTHPRAITARENVEEVVQRSLRQILGAQFTEKEGERLIARAYNPALPEAENRKRVARLRVQLTKAAMAKEAAANYFEKNGTLRGWQGKLWSLGDFDVERGGAQSQSGNPATRTPNVIDFNDLPE